MYSHTNDNTFSQPPFTQSTMYTEIEASNLVGSGHNFSSASRSSSSYVGSPTTAINFFQRSISSHSLYKSSSYYQPGHYDDFEDCSVRRAYSAGDLEGVSNYMSQRRKRADSTLSISKENSMIIEGILKVTKYSPEEKKERIERYRSKRNLRNFNKKIQYECRKTLADSRTRVKGRFARNDEMPIGRTTATTTMTMTEDNSNYDSHMLNDEYSSTYHHHMMAAGDEDYEGEENSWINILDYEFPSQNEN